MGGSPLRRAAWGLAASVVLFSLLARCEEFSVLAPESDLTAAAVPTTIERIGNVAVINNLWYHSGRYYVIQRHEPSRPSAHVEAPIHASVPVLYLEVADLPKMVGTLNASVMQQSLLWLEHPARGSIQELLPWLELLAPVYSELLDGARAEERGANERDGSGGGSAADGGGGGGGGRRDPRAPHAAGPLGPLLTPSAVSGIFLANLGREELQEAGAATDLLSLALEPIATAGARAESEARRARDGGQRGDVEPSPLSLEEVMANLPTFFFLDDLVEAAGPSSWVRIPRVFHVVVDDDDDEEDAKGASEGSRRGGDALDGTDLPAADPALPSVEEAKPRLGRRTWSRGEHADRLVAAMRAAYHVTIAGETGGRPRAEAEGATSGGGGGGEERASLDPPGPAASADLTGDPGTAPGHAPTPATPRIVTFVLGVEEGGELANSGEALRALRGACSPLGATVRPWSPSGAAPLASQLHVGASSDVLVGRSGPALSAAPFLRDGAAVVEIFGRVLPAGGASGRLRRLLQGAGSRVRHLAIRTGVPVDNAAANPPLPASADALPTSSLEPGEESLFQSPYDARFANWTGAECARQPCAGAYVRAALRVDVPRLVRAVVEALGGDADSQLPRLVGGRPSFQPPPEELYVQDGAAEAAAGTGLWWDIR